MSTLPPPPPSHPRKQDTHTHGKEGNRKCTRTEEFPFPGWLNLLRIFRFRSNFSDRLFQKGKFLAGIWVLTGLFRQAANPIFGNRSLEVSSGNPGGLTSGIGTDRDDRMRTPNSGPRTALAAKRKILNPKAAPEVEIREESDENFHVPRCSRPSPRTLRALGFTCSRRRSRGQTDSPSTTISTRGVTLASRTPAPGPFCRDSNFPRDFPTPLFLFSRTFTPPPRIFL